jgi:hypothetical protein
MSIPVLQYVKVSHTGKTSVWVARCNGVTLGLIKWHSAWRRYTLCPNDQTVWDRNCLTQVIAFIDEQMAERKAVDA